MIHRFELHFIKDVPNKPHPPVANICLKTYSKNGTDIFITSNAMSFSELDAQIDSLQKELDEIRKKAKLKFVSAMK